MNERIDELLQQARDFINEVSDADGVYHGKEYPQAVREKFAELIVKECANYAFSDEQERNAMLKHFGVE